jgi:hypothetical protein
VCRCFLVGNDPRPGLTRRLVALALQVVKGTVPLPTACLATPAFNPIMLENKTLTRYLGPKGLLPQAKRGTVVDDIATAVKGLKGALDWRVSKQMRLAAGTFRFTPHTLADETSRLNLEPFIPQLSHDRTLPSRRSKATWLPSCGTCARSERLPTPSMRPETSVSLCLPFSPLQDVITDKPPPATATEISKVVLTSTFGPGIEINDIIPRL